MQNINGRGCFCVRRLCKLSCNLHKFVAVVPSIYFLLILVMYCVEKEVTSYYILVFNKQNVFQ